MITQLKTVKHVKQLESIMLLLVIKIDEMEKIPMRKMHLFNNSAYDKACDTYGRALDIYADYCENNLNYNPRFNY